MTRRAKQAAGFVSVAAVTGIYIGKLPAEGAIQRQGNGFPVDELIDQIAGVTLTALSSLPARCVPRGDLATRRAIERVVFEVRTEIANACQQMADKNGEPPLKER